MYPLPGGNDLCLCKDRICSFSTILKLHISGQFLMFIGSWFQNISAEYISERCLTERHGGQTQKSKVLQVALDDIYFHLQKNLYKS